MSKICFVSDEIYPVKQGGAGSLILNLAILLLAEGHEVIFVLDIPRAAFERFVTSDLLSLLHREQCRAYQVDALCASMPYHEEDFLSRYLWESYRYDYACRQVYNLEKPDQFEFVDYCGPAYYALCSKIGHSSYNDSRLTVRVHGPIELIDQSARVKPIDFDRYTIYALERQCLRLAETILYPTPSFIQQVQASSDEPWFGEAKLSPPQVVNHPKRNSVLPEANIILFYGRLYAVKGVDLFVDAAVSLLDENPGSGLEFYLVGPDSMEPPVGEPGSYQEYLLQKIPPKHTSRFTFTGLLSRDKLEALLPRVKFAVFPSLYETYGFAANELRLAGIPIIVSDIPAYRDNLRSGVDALFFNGSSSDLSRQMKRLHSDEVLLKELSQPFTRKPADWLDAYRHQSYTSWMTPTTPTGRIRLLVCILDDNDSLEREEGAQTLASLRDSQVEDMSINLLKKHRQSDDSTSPTWFLGNLYDFHDADGNQVSAYQVLTSDALLLLRAGDRVAPEYITRCLDILQRQPRIGFVGCWKWIKNGNQDWLHTHPLAAMVELVPLETLSPLNRCIMRTPPGTLLIDLFDRQADCLGEAGYLWSLDSASICGIQIPEPLVWEQAVMATFTGNSALSYLIMHDRSTARQLRLVRYLAMLVNGYPGPLLPLQAFWADRIGLNPNFGPAGGKSIITRQNLRGRLIKRLGKGGNFSQGLLAMLRRVWSWLKILRLLWKNAE